MSALDDITMTKPGSDEWDAKRREPEHSLKIRRDGENGYDGVGFPEKRRWLRRQSWIRPNSLQRWVAKTDRFSPLPTLGLASQVMLKARVAEIKAFWICTLNSTGVTDVVHTRRVQRFSVECEFVTFLSFRLFTMDSSGSDRVSNHTN